MQNRFARALGTYVFRSPVTAGYVALLLLTHFWLSVVLSTADAQRVALSISTNLSNLPHTPVRSLVGSMLFFDGTLTSIASQHFVGTLITLGIGVGLCLAWLERRYGAMRAYAVFALGHVLATLITAQVIRVAIAHDWYPTSVRHAIDFGISYGAEAVLAAGALLLKRTRLLAAAAVVAWPVLGGDWSGVLPDFTTVGHLTAAAVGFACGAWLLLTARRGVSAPAAQPAPAYAE